MPLPWSISERCFSIAATPRTPSVCSGVLSTSIPISMRRGFGSGSWNTAQGDLDSANQAYKRCLKKLTGHGWCNFYLGLLEEQLGHSSNALYYYRRALKFAPELADPNVNPEVMSSKLMLGVQLQDRDRRQFVESLPMPYLEPGKVERVRRQYELPPTPEPEEAPATAAAQAPPRDEVQQVQPRPTPAQPVRPPRPVMPRARPRRRRSRTNRLTSSGAQTLKRK